METAPQKTLIRPRVAQTMPITAPITNTTINPAARSLFTRLRSSHRAEAGQGAEHHQTSGPVSAENVALIPECAECDARWLPADEERWQAHLGCDEHSPSRPKSASTARSVLSGSSRTRCSAGPGPG